jgi:ectoine hydroxylase-related dioxygenase (phytanoyl-CoA dioxygenase family)
MATASTTIVLKEYGEVFDLGDEKAIVEFFGENGYVVVRGIISPEDCEATMDEVESILRTTVRTTATSGGVVVGDEKVGFRWRKANTHEQMLVTNRFRVLTSGPVFMPQFVRNRVNPRLLQLFSMLFQRFSKTKQFMVTHDSGCFYPATLPIINGCEEPKPELKTPDDYPHLDMHPDGYKEPNGVTVKQKRDGLTYDQASDFMTENNLICESDGLQLAAVLNLLPNREQDGGFMCLPGFHKLTFDSWIAEHQKEKGSGSAKKVEVGLYHFDKNKKSDAKSVGVHEWRRVPAPSGAAIVWDQRLAHGSRSNASNRPRCAQFVKAIPFTTFTKERAQRRAKALQKFIQPNTLNTLNPFETSSMFTLFANFPPKKI